MAVLEARLQRWGGVSSWKRLEHLGSIVLTTQGWAAKPLGLVI